MHGWTHNENMKASLLTQHSALLRQDSIVDG
jgi:hypothetical protein